MRLGRFPVSNLVGLVLLCLVTPSTVAAEEFTPLSNRDTFVSLIDGRELRQLGVGLTVTPNGRISGRAFGSDVTGSWTWNGGYFCRRLVFGREDLGHNCQTVEISGRTIRFTSDQGQGEFADLTLR